MVVVVVVVAPSNRVRHVVLGVDVPTCYRAGLDVNETVQQNS